MNSVNTEPIRIEHHSKWFCEKLENKNSLLYLIEKENSPIGQVRFDKSEEGWDIDYSVDERYRGKGFGEIILKYGI